MPIVGSDIVAVTAIRFYPHNRSHMTETTASPDLSHVSSVENTSSALSGGIVPGMKHISSETRTRRSRPLIMRD